MNHSLATRQVACAVTSLAILMGCARSELLEVSGDVTWNGSPMPSGEIIFFPTDKHVAPFAGRIANGSYKLFSRPGEMRVEIEAARMTGKRDPVEGFEISELYVPAKFNKQSTLKVNVVADDDNHFDFALAE